jgi:SpoVK/Ycf46/Vps4 family AAA+-type ATPase
MEKAILLAEAISPCVLWIDNIDKVFPGDDRASMRTLSMFISWMQQKTKPVFTIITSNNIEGLPVELLCKSVFDEIFFIDLPILEERVDIFYAHLRKRRPETYKKYDVEMLAEKTRGFVGAEIEQVIIDAMYNAFDDNKREFTENDIVNSIKRIIPVSRLQRDKVEYFREWLVEGKVISASSEGVIKEERNGIVLEI